MKPTTRLTLLLLLVALGSIGPVSYTLPRAPVTKALLVSRLLLAQLTLLPTTSPTPLPPSSYPTFNPP